MPKTKDPVEILQEQNEYKKLVQKMMPKPKIAKDLFKAFWVGGTICTVGQVVLNFFMTYKAGMTLKEASAPTLAVMILLGAILTGLSIYHHIGEYAGAGAAVPITGFSNPVVSAAMEFKREGFVLGMGAKIFTVAGPVIVYGTLAGVAVAFLKWIIK